MAEDTASTTAAAATAATAADKGAASQTTQTDKGTTQAATTTTTQQATKVAATALSDTTAAAATADQKTGDWSADWRLKLAKGDAELAKRFERYQSPVAVAEALVNAQARISKGEVQKVLGANPTPEQITEYRAANGIPEKPDGYKLEPGEGRVIGDADKPVINKIVERLHGKHALPGQVNDAVQLYFDLQDETLAAREDADVKQRTEVTDALRAELGPEYRANINAVKGLLSTFPDGVGNAILDARLPDGTALFNSAPFLRHMMTLARELNPAATIVPGTSGNAASAIGDRIIALQAMQADTEGKYWKGTPEEQKALRDEFDKLTTAKLKLAA